MYNKMKKTREDAEYDYKYGQIPNDQLGRVAYILGKKAENEALQNDIEKMSKKLDKMKWDVCKFTMWKIIKPSARPRYSQRGGYIQTYVPRAKENGDWFEQFFWDNELPMVETPCIINIDIYEKTPASFKRRDAVLAEMGFITPWKRTGDVDNYAKAVLDMIQHGMLSDDSLVFETCIRRHYSIKPRTDVEIKYMHEWPDLDDNVTGRSKVNPL